MLFRSMQIAPFVDDDEGVEVPTIEAGGSRTRPDAKADAQEVTVTHRPSNLVPKRWRNYVLSRPRIEVWSGELHSNTIRRSTVLEPGYRYRS